MEEALGIRLKLLSANVESLTRNGQELLQRHETQEVLVNKEAVNMTYTKLRSAIQRFVTDMQQYLLIVQDPSANDLSTYTACQIRAEEVAVELDLTFNLKNIEVNRGTPLESHQATNVTSKLPKMELARFNGNLLKWHEFWDQFESNVDSRDLKDVDKLLYLQSVLDGEAKRALEGLDITNKNYQIAVSTLKERYGKHSTVVDAHYSALYSIRSADKSTFDCRRTFNEIERHLRVLKSLGEDVNHNYLRVIILQKFPEDLIYELRLKSEFDSFSIEQIRKQIECLISAKEASNRLKDGLNLSEQPGTSKQDYIKYSLDALHVMNERKIQSTRNPPSQYNMAGRRGRFKEFTGWNPENRHYTERKFNPNPRKRHMNEDKKEGDSKRMKPTCLFCGKGHFNDMCTEFKTAPERKQKLENRCYNCFARGHRASECRSLKTCYHCGRYGDHNRALCPSKGPTKTENLHICESNSRNEGITVLQTAIVNVNSGNIDCDDHVLRILLDCGSQRSYVTSKVVDALHLTKLETNTLSVFTFGASRPNEIESPVVRLDINTKTNNKTSIYANVVSHITNGVPTISNNFRGLDIKKITPNIITLADDSSMGDQVDILIGNDYYYSFMTGDKLKILDDLYLVNSIFGWVWSGRFITNESDRDQLSVLTYFQSSIELTGLCKPDLPLQKDDLRKLWDLESIGIMDSPATSREEEAIAQFNATTQYYDNRYHVKWPWIKFPPKLPSNFGLAHGRLISLLKRLDHNTTQAYDKILAEQLEQGIIEVITDHSRTEVKHPIHYLPHLCITKGDKLRLVYDASAKSNGNKSLNECLYRGPLLLKNLTGLLIRFRENRIGVVADVEKAFLQVGLQDDDRDVTRFLWVKDITQAPSPDNLLHLRFQRVPFGVISSPFLLNAVIQYHLKKGNNNVCRRLAEDLYVDNLVTGSDSVKGALSLYSSARALFDDLSMNLREWNSNSLQVRTSIPQQQRSKEIECMKVLGLTWNLKDDSLSLQFKMKQEVEERIVTKRETLRLIASIFDPCGYTVPLVLPAKLFLQTLWHQKIDWDTPFTEDILIKCKAAIENLKCINEIKVPRCITMIDGPDNITSYELHAFTDASEQAYAAVVYLRVNCGSKVTTNIVIGKGRLAGKEQQSDLRIPKLELLGAFIGSKLIQSIITHTNLHISRVFLWTDSQIVINWCSTEKLLPPFVAKRVEEIRQITNIQIRYVPTQLNPADIATRPNVSAEGIKYWLEGPIFLKQAPDKWPLHPTTPSECNTLTSICSGGQGPPETPVEQDDCQTRLGTSPTEANKCQENSDGPIGQEENKFRDKLRQIQIECFGEEANGVKTDLGRSLGVYKDKHGLLRCGGRLSRTDWSYDQKHPILLPRNHEVTSKIIETTHQQNYHVGVPHTLSLVRKKYWIPKGRSQVQQVLRQCLPCRKHSGGPFKLPPMAPLPKERVTYSHPYTYTGIDYFGPITVRNDGLLEKRWVCLFTCLAIRAIHMEVVLDMTAEECLLAIRRFAAVRGLPKVIVSNNATQFKLTAEVLTSDYCVVNGIKWRFIPELSPWFGGFYERLIGLVKHCLKRTVDKHLLTSTQLTTIIKEVEAVVNTRPLTTLSGELDHVLTPADFLCSGGIAMPQESQKEFLQSATMTKVDLVEGWKRGQKILKEYVEMFTNQYLTRLRERRTFHKQPRVTVDAIPHIGQLVQVKGGSNRLLWKVGRISSIITSKDGHIRVAKVDTGPHETLTRSIAHLYPLEIPDSDNDSQSDSNSDDTHPTQVTTIEPNRNVAPALLSDQLSVSPDTDGRMVLSEPDEHLRTSNPRPSRLSAQRAREKVREWTAHLLCLSS